MNYNEMVRIQKSFETLTVKNINQLIKLNDKLHLIEKSIVKSAIEIDKLLRLRVKDDEDLLVDYSIVCEISFPVAPVARALPDRRIFPRICETGSDWTEYLKGISELGSVLDSGENYNPFLTYDGELSKMKHCWLFYILYAKFHMTWREMCCVLAAWSDLEVTHHYCSEVVSIDEIENNK